MDIESNLPLTEVTYFILLSLASRPQHGYAIMKDVTALSNNRVSLSTGTLYGAIKRLLDQGWILRADDPQSVASGRQRKVYQMTDLGWLVLQAEIKRLNSLVVAAKLRTAGGNV